ncbi:MAG: ABC transporter substrate-binding protein [Chloroflexi bacterium]|nr:ABC transporter substrate-binding protein [Chloroflexota bacterium]
MARGAHRLLLMLSALALGAFLVACGAAATPSEKQVGAGQAGGAEVEGTVIPPGIPDHPYPAVIPADEKERDPAKYKSGGLMNYTSLDPPHLDIALSSSCTVYNINDMVYNKLVRAKLGPFGDQMRIQLEGDLAKSWEVSADGKTYTFKLHEGVKFQNLPPVNGRELTAEDVVWSFEDYRKGGVQTSYFDLVEKTEAVDKYTFRVILKQPFVDFVASLGEMSYIRPKEIKAEDGNFRKRAIGSGPFILREWTPKQGVRYDKNPDYFEQDTLGRRLPYLDKADMFVIPDSATALAAYRAHQVETVSATTVQEADAIKQSDPDTAFQSNDNRMSRGNIDGVHLRLDKAPFNDVRVRRALSMALDRKGISDTLYEGRGAMAIGMNWTFFLDKFPAFEDYGPWYQHNPKKARELLAEAGYPNGLTINLVDWYLRTPADVLIAQWREAGITVKRREVDNPTHVVLLNEKKFEEMTGVIWGIPQYTVDGGIYPWWHSKGAKNFDNLKDPEMDRLLDAQRVEADPAKRKVLLKQIWDRYLDQVYQIWFTAPRRIAGWRSYVKNHRYHGVIGSLACYTTGNQLRIIWLDK